MIGDQTLFQRADMVEAGWARGKSGSGCLEGAAAAQLSKLRGGQLGTEGS